MYRSFSTAKESIELLAGNTKKYQLKAKQQEVVGHLKNLVVRNMDDDYNRSKWENAKRIFTSSSGWLINKGFGQIVEDISSNGGSVSKNFCCKICH